jgi:hypothetical protein
MRRSKVGSRSALRPTQKKVAWHVQSSELIEHAVGGAAHRAIVEREGDAQVPGGAPGSDSPSQHPVPPRLEALLYPRTHN